MWTTKTQSVAGTHRQRYEILGADGQPLNYQEVLRLWGADPAFRQFFNQTLAAAPQAGFRWETPPLTKSTLDRPFEFVLLDAPRIDRTPEPDAFAEHFDDANMIEGVFSFANLGRNAILVAPSPQGPHAAYVHLAAFVRGAPQTQQDALWQVVAQAMAQRLSDKPVWLSTAGMGVAWLHIRLDDRPKYYGHEPYRQWP